MQGLLSSLFKWKEMFSLQFALLADIFGCNIIQEKPYTSAFVVNFISLRIKEAA